MMPSSSTFPRFTRVPGVLVFALVLTAGFVPAARAASTSTSSALADTTRPATFMKEVVVTGTRFPRRFYQSPQSVSFVNNAQLREAAPITIGDVLTLLPGVDMSKDSPWEQRPVLRGMSGQRVLVLMDGTPMNSARGNGPHPSLVDPSQIDRVEVVRGPSSVAYGSDALGGVINIITREAPHSSGNDRNLAGSVTFGGTSAERQTNESITLVPHIGRFSAFLGAGGHKLDDYLTPDGRLPHSGFSDYNWIGNLRYDLTDRLIVRGGAQRYSGKDIGVPGLDYETAGEADLFSFPFYNRDYEFLSVDHAYEQGWMAKAHVKVYRQREYRNFYSSYAADSAHFYKDPYFGFDRTYNPASSTATSIVQLQDRFFDLTTYGAQAQVMSRKTDLYQFTMGVDALTDRTGGNNIRRRTYFDGAVPRATTTRITQSLPTGHFDNYGLYFQNEWYVDPSLTASIGGRATQYHYKTDVFQATPTTAAVAARSVTNSALCGSLGLVYKLADDLRVTGGVSNGYRQPNAQDLFFNGPGSVGTVLGDPDLKAERSISYDAGVRFSPSLMALALNVYYSTYKDLIEALPAGPGTYQYTNVATARMYGFEIEGEHHFMPGWTGHVSLSDQIGDITSADAILKIYGVNKSSVPLELVPPLKGTMSVRWNDAGRRVWIEPTARFSWRTDRLPPAIPGVGQLNTFKKEYVVGDVMMGFDVAPWHVTFGVKNFTNRAYRPSLASVEDPGASGYGTVSVTF